jgi:hypothetical protein
VRQFKIPFQETEFMPDRILLTRAVHVTPFASAPNVLIAYPQFDDWKRAGKFTLLPSWSGPVVGPGSASQFQKEKSDHEDDVLKHLNMMQARATGRAVLAEFRTRPSYSVLVFPFEFRPPDEGKTPGALTESVWVPQTAAERARNAMPPGTQVCKKGWCRPDRRTTAQSVDVFFTANRFSAGQADGVLVHELLHASRYVSGVLDQRPMGRGYGNSEEFLAQTIENIYRSEKKLPLYDYGWAPLDPASFFDPEENARTALYDLRNTQRSLFDAVADVSADFNPVKVVRDEIRRIETQNPYEVRNIDTANPYQAGH